MSGKINGDSGGLKMKSSTEEYELMCSNKPPMNIEDEVKKILVKYRKYPIYQCGQTDEASEICQLFQPINRFKKALDQARKGEEIDLPEEEFELFNSIVNYGISKCDVEAMKICDGCPDRFAGCITKEKAQDMVKQAVKAERERIRQWGNERCFDHYIDRIITRHNCSRCWQSL